MNRKTITALALTLAAVIFLAPAAALAIDLSAPLPVEVINDNGWGTIKKIYELPKDEDRTKIPISDLEVGGVKYICSDVLREEIAQADEKEYSDVFTVESKVADDATVAALLPPERAIKTDDGFEGILKLDASTVYAESTGQTKNSRKVSITRVYKNLKTMDIEPLDKEVTESGRVYSLVDVQWQEDNSYNGDDYEVGTRYIATVKYERDAVSYTDDGFIITAKYNGTVVRGKDALIRYTVIFTRDDAALVPPSPEPTDELSSPEPDGLPEESGSTETSAPADESGTSPGLVAAIIAVIVVIVGGAAVFVLYQKGIIRFERRNYYDDSPNDGNNN
jgi:hypothetical protein